MNNVQPKGYKGALTTPKVFNLLLAWTTINIYGWPSGLPKGFLQLDAAFDLLWPKVKTNKYIPIKSAFDFSRS